MTNKGVISQRLFAYYMTDTDHQSFIEFWGYDTAQMSDPNLFQWIPLAINRPYWNFAIEGFRVGDNPTIQLYG